MNASMLSSLLPRLLAAGVSGAMLGVLVPPWGIHWLHWVAYLPAFWMMREGDRRTNLVLAFVFGTVAQALIFSWIVDTIVLFSNIPAVLAWGVLVLFSSAYGLPYFAMWWMLLPMRRRLGSLWMVGFPAWAVVVEYIASRLTLFPYQQGISQYAFAPTWQLASVTGVWGLTFLLVGFNGVLAEFMYRRREGRSDMPWRWALAWAGMTLAVAGWGTARHAEVERVLAEAPTLRVQQMQLDKGMAWRMSHAPSATFNMWVDMTQSIPKGSVDLVIWPEGASPYSLNGQRAALLLWDLARRGDFDLVVGAGTREREANTEMGERGARVRIFNSVYAFDIARTAPVSGPGPQETLDALLKASCDVNALAIYTPFEARALRLAARDRLGQTPEGVVLPEWLAWRGDPQPSEVLSGCVETLTSREKELRTDAKVTLAFEERMWRDALTWSTLRAQTSRFSSPLEEDRFEMPSSGQWVWSGVEGGCVDDDCDGFTLRCPTNEPCVVLPAPPHYDKMVPLPFGEYIPFASVFPWLADLIEGPGNFRAGTHPLVFEVGGVRAAAPICYEGILGYVCDAYEAPDVLLNVTNDAWFGPTPASDLHGMLVTARAVELGIPVVRSAYSGTSFIVEPHGTVHDKTALFEVVNRPVEVRMARVWTLYSVLGDWFVWLCSVGVGLLWWRAGRVAE